jgi:hypothetical protein
MVKEVKTPDAQVVTANRLRDGAVVFLTATGEWSINVDDSEIARDAAAAAKLQAIGDQAMTDRIVVTPYLIEVAVRGQLIQPVSYRERIRAFGPSVDARAPDRLSA